MPSADQPAGMETGVSLAPLTTLGVGGRARWFVRATTVEDVVATHTWCRERAVPFSVIGGGSNLVVADEGVTGLVLQIAIGGIDFGRQGDATVLRVGAGEPWDTVVAAAVSKGFQGVECLSGIPGSTGGTPVQNVGAYGQEVSDTIAQVTVLDRESGEVETLRGTDCRFGYRTSRFKSDDVGRFVVCEVTYELRHAHPTVTYPDLVDLLERRGVGSPSVADVRDAVLSIRRTKGMVLDASDPDTRSVGSFFMNPIVDARHHARLASVAGGAPGFALPSDRIKVPAAWLIEHAGFSKGHGSARLACLRSTRWRLSTGEEPLRMMSSLWPEESSSRSPIDLTSGSVRSRRSLGSAMMSMSRICWTTRRLKPRRSGTVCRAHASACATARG